MSPKESLETEVREAAQELGKEISRATGKNLKGDVVGEPRFAGFQLTPEIKNKALAGVELARSDREQALRAFKGALQHLKNQQAAYFRNLLLPRLSDLIDGNPKEERDLEPVYFQLDQLSGICRCGRFDLDEVAQRLNKIEKRIKEILEKQERVRDLYEQVKNLIGKVRGEIYSELYRQVNSFAEYCRSKITDPREVQRRHAILAREISKTLEEKRRQEAEMIRARAEQARAQISTKPVTAEDEPDPLADQLLLDLVAA